MLEGPVYGWCVEEPPRGFCQMYAYLRVGSAAATRIGFELDDEGPSELVGVADCLEQSTERH